LLLLQVPLVRRPKDVAALGGVDGVDQLLLSQRAEVRAPAALRTHVSIDRRRLCLDLWVVCEH
jgi:hypothetical protein